MAGPAARALLLLAVLALLLRDAQAQVQPVAQAPSPPSAPPALQCAPEAEAAARDRDAAVRRWHAALQLEQTAHRFEADAQFYAGALARNASEELPAWRNASAAQLQAETALWSARRAAALAETRAAEPAAKAVLAADCDTAFSLSSRPLARLQPALYPLRPNVSFVLQYFRQPAAIAPIVSYFHSCTRGTRGVENASSPLAGLTSELVVNVDSGEDAAAWVEAAATAGDGFVTLVVSPNVHEIRGYNRAAAVARGDTLVLLQDDDTPTGSCDWLADVAKLLAARPLVGAVALKKACITVHGDCRWAWTDEAVKHYDPELQLRYQYVTVADFAPLVVRASAYADIGGCDEGAVPPGESGILLDYEMTMRLWAAGWHVTQLHVRSLKGGLPNMPELAGGTSHGISLALRGKNQGLNSIGSQSRFTEKDSMEVTMEVRRKNAALVVDEQHRDKLEKEYAARDAHASMTAQERQRLMARLAAFAKARNDPGELPTAA